MIYMSVYDAEPLACAIFIRSLFALLVLAKGQCVNVTFQQFQFCYKRI